MDSVPLFSIPGDSAFSNWTYRVDYSELEGTPETVRESALDITLTDLQPGTSYQFMITAEGPGGEKQNPAKFVFTTKMDGKEHGYKKLSSCDSVI